MTRLPTLVLLFAALAGAAPLLADDDQERARGALERGEIRPLDEILAEVRRKVPGEVVAVDLERVKEGWRYEIRVLAADGRRREVIVDAASAVVSHDKADD